MDEEAQAVHQGFLCDVCGSDPIRGTRYRCTVRKDYDLCETCEKRDTAGYPMTKIKVPVEAENEQVGKAAEPEKKEREEEVNENVAPPMEEEPVQAQPVPPVEVAQPEPIVQPIEQPIVHVEKEPVVQPIEKSALPPVQQPIKMQVAQPVDRLRNFEKQIQSIRAMGFEQDPDFLEVLLQTEGGDMQKVMDMLLR